MLLADNPGLNDRMYSDIMSRKMVEVENER